MDGYGNFHGGYEENAAYDEDFEASLQAVREYQTQQLLFPTVYRYAQDGIPYPMLALDNNEPQLGMRDSMVGSGDFGYDLCTMAPPPPANQMIPHTPANRGSSMRRSRSSARSSAPQHTRSRGGNEALEAQYIARAPYIGYPTPNVPRDESQWVGVSLEHGNNQRPAATQPSRRPRVLQGGSPVTQAQMSSMQNFVTRIIRPHPPSTASSGASGSTGATFSSVSTSEHGDFRRTADAVQSPNLGYQLSQLQIADNVAGFDGNRQPSRPSHGGHAYPSATYGQVPATRHIPQQDVCSHCPTCMHIRSFHPSYPPAQYAGDHTTVGDVRIGYCPIRGCNRGPGSRRPFPRTCNLLEHLRGVHRADIPRGAKLRAWLVDQGYNPDLLVEYVKPRC